MSSISEQVAREHEVTIEADGLLTARSLTCNAPADALCHAVWTCECEYYYDARVRNGVPAHRYDPYNEHAWHAGRFDPDECNLRDWYEGEDGESLEGEITVPVTATWEGDYYVFEMEQP